jgi:non-specific serine/threonine protein kinase
VTASNAVAVAQLCARLDGIPLAIELAAARVKVLAVEQIAARLRDRFHLLTGGGRTAPPRHQTLRAAMDWSYDLLSEKERALLRRLSVFAGGCTLETVEAVCSGDGVEAADMLDLVTSLVDKSLVNVETPGGEARYRLLETVRQYGLERLGDAAEEGTLRLRHRDWYLAFAESAGPKLWGPEEAEWLERLEAEHDNLRTALEWSKTAQHGAGAGLRLATALWEFWESRSYLSEGRTWLEEMASLDTGAPLLLKATALNAAGTLAHRQGDYDGVSALCQQALTLSQAQGNKTCTAWALHLLGHAAEERGDPVSSVDLREHSLALYREAGDKWGVAWMTNCMGDVARSQGNFDRAADLLEEALSLCKEMGTTRLRTGPLHNLGHVMLRLGDRRRAEALFTECMVLARERGDRRSMISCVAGLAGVHAEGEPELAARLLGAADALRAGAGEGMQLVDRIDFERNLAAVRSRLGEKAFQAAWADGRTITLEEAVEKALTPEQSLPGGGGKPDSPSLDEHVGLLTSREREVAALIAQGLSNREIASRLVIAERTAEGHVQSILNKLGFNSRTQIAAWAVEHGLRTA